MFFWKKKPPAGLHQTEDRIGMHQTPHFQSKPLISNQNPSKHPIIGFWRSAAEAAACKYSADSGIVMVDGTFFGDSFEQDRSWDDSGTTISGI